VISEAEVALRLSRRRSTAELVVEAERAVNRREVELNHALGERPLDQQERAELVAIQKRADVAYGALSLGTPLPRANEPPMPYRVRLAAGLKDHDPQWRNVDLGAVARNNRIAWENAESSIYRAAIEHGMDPLDRWRPDADTRLRERFVIEPDGSRSSTWHGRPSITLGTMTTGRSLAVKSFGPRFRFK
jgi:hypothetical protein